MLLQKRVDQIVALRILLLFGHFPLSQGYDPTHKLSDTLETKPQPPKEKGDFVSVALFLRFKSRFFRD
jgi:hypothetical protein